MPNKLDRLVNALMDGRGHGPKTESKEPPTHIICPQSIKKPNGPKELQNNTMDKDQYLYVILNTIILKCYNILGRSSKHEQP